MYIVLGGGIQGPAVAYALSILKPQNQIWLIESNKERRNHIKKFFANEFQCENITFISNDSTISVFDLFKKAIKNATIVSTLPYELNEKIGKQSIDLGCRYFDLGGHVQTSIAINEYAKNNNGTVLTDLGLAPGLVNILAEYALTLVSNPKNLYMFCGGLPVDSKINEIGYKIVFSPEGLVNEYFNECKALIDGEIVDIEPMGDLGIAQFDGTVYESFNTSGAIHTTLQTAKKMGVKNCRYQTLRYVGHAKVFRFLKNDLKMTNEQIAKLLKKQVGYTTEDKVIIGIKVEGDVNYIVDYSINSNKHFTAMQRATGFSAAATVVGLENKSGILNYRDVDVQKLIKDLGRKELLPELNYEN